MRQIQNIGCGLNIQHLSVLQTWQRGPQFRGSPGHTHVVSDVTQQIPSGGRTWAEADNVSTEGVYSHWSKGVTAPYLKGSWIAQCIAW
jgi:hypothetical protein